MVWLTGLLCACNGPVTAPGNGNGGAVDDPPDNTGDMPRSYAGRWEGTITYTERGTAPWDVPAGQTGSGKRQLGATETYRVIGSEQPQNGTAGVLSINLRLERDANTTYSDVGLLEEQVQGTCPGSSQVQVIQRTLDGRDIQVSNASTEPMDGRLVISADTAPQPGPDTYWVDFTPETVTMKGTEKITMVTEKLCPGGTKSDSSYSGPSAVGYGPQPMNVRGNVPEGDVEVLKGTYDLRNTFFRGINTSVHVEWELYRISE